MAPVLGISARSCGTPFCTDRRMSIAATMPPYCYWPHGIGGEGSVKGVSRYNMRRLPNRGRPRRNVAQHKGHRSDLATVANVHRSQNLRISAQLNIVA